MMVRRANAIRPAEPALQQALLAMSTPKFSTPPGLHGNHVYRRREPPAQFLRRLTDLAKKRSTAGLVPYLSSRIVPALLEALVAHPTLSANGGFQVHSAHTESNSGTHASGRLRPIARQPA